MESLFSLYTKIISICSKLWQTLYLEVYDFLVRSVFIFNSIRSSFDSYRSELTSFSDENHQECEPLKCSRIVLFNSVVTEIFQLNYLQTNDLFILQSLIYQY